MAVYLLYMISPVIVYIAMGFFDSRSLDNEKKKRRYLIICGVIMALMIGLRYKGVGSGDTGFYYRNWESMAGLPLSALPKQLMTVDLEYGYQICVFILSHILPWGQWALIISGAFFSVSVCFFICRNCKNPVLALMVFNCLGLFNFMVQGLRQAIAMCICLWAIEQCKNKKPIRFLLLIVLAASFHASAIVAVIFYVLANFKLNFKSLLIFAAAVTIGLLLLPTLFDILNYFLDDDYGMTSASESGGVVAILIYITILLFGILYRDPDREYPMYVYALIIGAVVMLLRNSVSGIAERVSYYFAFGQMVVLSNSIYSMKDQKTKILINMIAAMLCFGVAIYKASYSILIPYTFFWQG